MLSPCWRDLQLGPAQPVMGFPRQGATGSCLSIRWRGGVMVLPMGSGLSDHLVGDGDAAGPGAGLPPS